MNRYPQSAVGDRPELRFSQLKHMALSPAHFIHRLTGPQKRKKNFDLGTATHALVLGGQALISFPGKSRTVKGWKAFETEHKDSGALLLTQPEMDLALAAAQSVKSHPLAMKRLEGHREQQLKPWAIAGRKCGGRPDVVNDKAAFLSELKTGATSEPWRFTRFGIRLGYASQCDWYAQGARRGGTEIREAFIVAVEMSAPFVVTVFRMTERALLYGTKCWSTWFERLLVCEDSNEWPGYVQHETEFDVPDYEDPDFGDGDKDEDEEAA